MSPYIKDGYCYITVAFAVFFFILPQFVSSIFLQLYSLTYANHFHFFSQWQINTYDLKGE